MDRITNTELITREIDAAPFAASLIEGHRDFGYSLETALADIIDNSISAGATEVVLEADTATEYPWIALADNGRGMSEPELVEAMRLGSKNPTDVRAIDDLGRFGLGLKSASFSQCRQLTVLTRRDSKISCARWDLDGVSKRNNWNLELIDSPQAITGHELLPVTGTVVIWEKLDRLDGGYDRNWDKRAAHMNGELAGAERYLRLVFHRFIEGKKPRLKILLNGRVLKPIDPLASDNPACQKDPEEIMRLEQGDVRIRCHTLPHHTRMPRERWEEIGGPEGHLKTQGLYVYRENRLIISGGWLGLARQTELTKLCRIAIDIPNTMDADWKIDVKKASAQLPAVVRERLKKVVERFLGTSKRTYKKRGQKLVDATRFPVWNRVQREGNIVFRPNLEHPVFRSFANELPEEFRDGFDRCLRLLGSALPIDTLHAELTGNAEAVHADVALSDELEIMVLEIGRTLLSSGMKPADLPDTLQSHPFLRANWDAVVPLLKNFIGELKE
ncbi:ATP-binding protein [Hoeflea sp. Naph1]|uniref:ATP-binding protein n=1 Tax=Hoeflea sp. Naph1 TaxID=3388653 RepID=UPI00398FEB30